MTTVRQRFQCAGHTATDWSAIVTVPLEREVLIETDTLRMKVGNGVDVYGDLPYQQVDAADIIGLASALASKLDDSQASAFGLTVLSAADAAALKTLLSLVKGDVGLGNVDNTADAVKNVLSAAQLTTGRTMAITGDLTWTSPSFDGTGNVTAAGTLATVNTDVGSFGSATAVPVLTVNGKGQLTAVTTAALGTMATQAASAVAITGGSGAFTSALGFTLNQNATTTFAVTNTDSTNGSSRGQITVQGGDVALRCLAINANGGYFGTTSAHDLFLQRGTTNIVQIKATGIDVTGEARCDSLRVDVAATAGAKTQTDYIPISCNGTTKYILLGS